MSSAAGTILSYVKGSVALGHTFGTQIANPAFKRLRFTSDGLKGSYRTEKSREVVNSFRTKQYRRVGLEAGGQIGLELIYGNLDDLLEGLLYSTWQRTPQRYNATADTEITDITSGTGVITIVAAAAGNENRVGTFAVGHLVRATGETTNPGNNFLKRVTAATATSLTVSATGLVTNAAPNAGYRLKAVGIEAPAVGNISLTTSGITGDEVAIINGTGVDFVALGLVAGMWFKASDFPQAVNNTWFRAKTVASGQIRCDRALAVVVTDTAAAAQVRLWLPDLLRDGSAALVWFDLERQLPQLATPEYHYFLSQVPNSWELSLSPQGILACTMGFIGARRTTGTARVAGATEVAADAAGAIPRTGEMFDTSSNVAKIALGNTLIVDAVTQCSWAIANNASGLPVVGNLGAGRILRPSFGPTFRLERYYDSRDVLATIEADTAVGCCSVLTDPIGSRALILDYPSAKPLSADLNDIQADAELGAPAEFGAIEHTGYNCQVQLMRLEEYA